MTMRRVAMLVAAMLLYGLAAKSGAQHIPLVIHKCTDSKESFADVCGRAADVVVCIDDFNYNPSIITPRVGDMVAWVNVEECAGKSGRPVDAIEDIVANGIGIGCDTH